MMQPGSVVAIEYMVGGGERDPSVPFMFICVGKGDPQPCSLGVSSIVSIGQRIFRPQRPPRTPKNTRGLV